MLVKLGSRKFFFPYAPVRRICNFRMLSLDACFKLPIERTRLVPPIVVKEILEAGVHFGHQKSRWNPKMRPYIYGHRNGIHIIDLKETVRGLLRAKKYLKKVASQGSLILFVGTKRQASG